ncbi:hypothetical protein BJ875DRAFT_458898 [Amylocarpus encephaloides]|uniref:DUF2423 domain-containing protein n=1 Tax=Amylocarpus encephaloides TaxID=45428 RepID=A0A9P7YLY7_9HELO|nr:hypothetical protein BJ875DRAFT_458898 [Amylocarpus encephaloides]
MAKGARASVRKANNARLKQMVFGPVEAARNERLSAMLLELASQPKPTAVEEISMAEGGDASKSDDVDTVADSTPAEAMDVAQDGSKPTPSKKGRVEKRRHKSGGRASIVFPKYKNGKRVGKPAQKRK